MSTTPDADELETRARLQDLGVSYVPTAEDAPDQEPGEDHLEHAAPAAEEETPAPTVRRSRRLPDWWRRERPELPMDDPDAEDEPEEPAAEDDQEEPELTKEDTSSRRPGVRERVRTWVETVEQRNGYGPAVEDTTEDTGEDSGDDDGDTGEGEGPQEGGLVRKTAPGKRRGFTPRRRPRFAAPGIPYTMKAPQQRRSLVEIIRSTPTHVVWLYYSGSALGAGFWLGLPQWVSDGVDFLAAEHPTFTDTYSVTCYGLAAGVFLLDLRSRGWLLPLAWAVRIPTASLVVGVFMNGDDTPISQMF